MGENESGRPQYQGIEGLPDPWSSNPSEAWPDWEQIGNSIGNVSPCGHNAKWRATRKEPWIRGL